MCMGALSECIYVCIPCVPGAQGDLKKASNPLALDLQDGCESLCGYWEFNPDPLQEQQKDLNHLVISPVSLRQVSFVTFHGLEIKYFILSYIHIYNHYLT